MSFTGDIYDVLYSRYVYTLLQNDRLERFSRNNGLFCSMHGLFVGINISGTCLISENRIFSLHAVRYLTPVVHLVQGRT